MGTLDLEDADGVGPCSIGSMMAFSNEKRKLTNNMDRETHSITMNWCAIMDAQKQRKQLIRIRKRDRVGGRVGSEPDSHFASPPVLCTLNDFIAHLPSAKIEQPNVS